jgi:hypothetical protein
MKNSTFKNWRFTTDMMICDYILSEDHEHSMARSELKVIQSAIDRLMQKLKGEGNIESWVQSKITKAADYIDTAADYLNSDETETKQIDEISYNYSLPSGFAGSGKVVAGLTKKRDDGSKYTTAGTVQKVLGVKIPGSFQSDLGLSGDRKLYQSDVNRHNKNAPITSQIKSNASGITPDKKPVSVKPVTTTPTSTATSTSTPPTTASGGMQKALKDVPFLGGVANIAKKYDDRVNYRNQPPEIRKQMGLQNSYDFKGEVVVEEQKNNCNKTKKGISCLVHGMNDCSKKYSIAIVHPGNFLEQKDKSCWDGYKQVGMKKKDNKMVPNCVPEETVKEACWKGYKKKGMKTMFGKKYPNCVKIKKEETETTDLSLSEEPRIPRKPGQPAGSKKHSDLYTDENPKGTIQGLGFKDVATAKQSVSKIKNSGKTHAHKIQAAVAMEQRAKEMGKSSEAAVFRSFINSMKEKTKEMNEEGLRAWFGKSKSEDGKPGWVNVVTGGTCASDEPGEGVPKCVSSAKRASMTKAERLSAAARKGAADPGQQEKTGAAKPTYVSTDSPKNKMNEETDKKGKGSGTKDACYTKVKSRYSVWPSAYASGALVKCRKVGAANWGNSTKNEETNIEENYLRIQSRGTTYTILLNWRGKYITSQMFFQQFTRPTKAEVTREVRKVYPNAIVLAFNPSIQDPTKPLLFTGEPNGPKKY